MVTLKGIPVATGIAIARPFVLEVDRQLFPFRHSLRGNEIEREVRLFGEAVKRTEAAIRGLREQTMAKLGKGTAAIFDAHLAMLKDPVLIDETMEQIKVQQTNAAYVFYKILHKYTDSIAGLGDEYLRERSKDVMDVGNQILKNLIGAEKRTLKNVRDKVVVLAEDLTPAETADIPHGKVMGFATIAGSRTSHTAIVAQALEIPALVGVQDMREVTVGDKTVILDAVEGYLILDPDSTTLARYQRQMTISQQRRLELRKLKQVPAETPDGHRVSLMANLELPIEVAAAQTAGAEGVGLFRTEFLFMNKFPSEEEQYHCYQKIVREMAPRPVVIRTLDMGGDKFPSAASALREANPFLGLRGIRMCLANREIFDEQLKAILRASAHGNVELMFPLISSVEEYREAREIVEEVKSELKSAHVKFDENIPVGAMIETPSAALVTEFLAKEADFFSIGTNDLIQYSIAVDRGNPSTNYLYEPLHPAILRLTKMIIEHAHASQIRVTVCGELAADPMAAAILLGMSLDVFSVSPVSVSQTKKLIRSISFVEARALAIEALTLPTAQAVKELIKSRLAERVASG